MTAANEFIPETEEEEVSGPNLFGLQLTSKTIGIAIAVVGLLLAGAGIFKLVLPAMERGSNLNADIQTKQQEIEQQNEKLLKREQAERELEEAKQRRTNVTALFADEATLNTLMFDLNEQLNQINAGIEDDALKAQIKKFEPVELENGEYEKIVDDGSLGSQVNGKLRRREYEVEFEGSFEQTRDFLIALERMQPMLVVRNFESELMERSPEVRGEYRQGQFVPLADQPQRRIETSFDLHALLPLSQEELDAKLQAAQEAEEEEQK
ncbi:pilus assembly protein PilO [Lyngbya sp. CCY1209]|jgi:type IV pilus assembly protein PilO|uniref:pilus assembly protein PilO n=1 Tax=Lyngbya sp. CCY1209 TaxID=2886103 RepID=UPI002D214982|nr:pilus assembly protein PilO [Lyngbya sp. CCY1209]MEB3886952.1 pilus assembly protein PilO [Lyngbya sp. CCY1209]